ncbi:response regulator [Halarcobacter mediterraneus]|uniref:Response regulator n=1 Tax=Halarcobacter mediterraneus TaxID=2023153 RepID=A0A4Q1ASU3_9BACT|nr:response regulator [Halarcobacter mediterraneus]RXK12763.1 response regulator [Halarcobacter mediterraneus]
MKCLVVDDSKMARRMTIKALSDLISENDEIIQASNGEEAFNLYKEYNPDICLMDLTMPVIDGFEATLNIKKFDEKAKIIIISADIQETSMEKAKKNGALGFIKKPVNSDNLKVMLEKLGLF